MSLSDTYLRRRSGAEPRAAPHPNSVSAEASDEWLLGLDDDTYDQVAAGIDMIGADGSTLGRPLVDRISGSRIHNLKELRPGSAGSSEIRILAVFDPVRRAVLLIAGDKAGNWQGRYESSVPLAEQRYDGQPATSALLHNRVRPETRRFVIS